MVLFIFKEGATFCNNGLQIDSVTMAMATMSESEHSCLFITQ